MVPYFRRSCTTAWKKANTNTSGRKAKCGQDSSNSSDTLLYVFFMFILSPFGGSFTTLRELCRMPNGNEAVGSVVSHNRNSRCGLASRFMIIFSSSFIQSISRWQFCSSTHCPRSCPVSVNRMASSPCPCPRLTDRILLPPISILSASFWISSLGLAPGLIIHTMGLYCVLCLYTSMYFRIGGVQYFSPISGHCAMNWLTAKNTRSTRKQRSSTIRWKAVSFSE
mmetsp:Transcript_3414/g.6495  ORF Transcript_3414/g.6495 Transcript_3414/m.6495 type:complete len:224 (-) Transcript_3414:6400-7071(-)